MGVSTEQLFRGEATKAGGGLIKPGKQDRCRGGAMLTGEGSIRYGRSQSAWTYKLNIHVSDSNSHLGNAEL